MLADRERFAGFSKTLASQIIMQKISGRKDLPENHLPVIFCRSPHSAAGAESQ